MVRGVWLAVTLCLGLLVGLPPPLAEAQTTTSGAAEDAGVLREAKAAADTSA